jgi:peptidoglycan/LPS O-acetylase OafA/YrhL
MKSRIPELDGIRGMAIFLVLYQHFVVNAITDWSNPLLRHLAKSGIQAWSGVDLFFVLSGFLIGGILLDARGSENYFRTFYLRRVFRILPIYFVICGAYFALCAVVPGIKANYAAPLPWYIYASFLQNFWLAHHPWNTFLDHSWSLAVEEQFYLTLPAIIWFTPRRALWKVISALAIAGVAVRCIGFVHYYPAWRTAARVLVICRADSLLLGVLAALVVRNERALGILTGRKWLLRGMASASFVFVAVSISKQWGMTSDAMCTVGYTVNAVLYASVLLIAVTAPASIFARLFRLKALRWMGTIAYCLYLVHLDIQVPVYRLFGYARPQLTTAYDLLPLAAAVAASLLVSHLSWKYFESAMVGVGHRFTYKRSVDRPEPMTAEAPMAIDSNVNLKPHLL